MDTIQVNNPLIGIGKDAIQRSFEISPETVFGVLVGLLLIAVFYMAWRIQRLSNKLIELNVSNITILKDLFGALTLLKEEGTNVSDKIIEKIDSTREHILDNIQLIKNHGK